MYQPAITMQLAGILDSLSEMLRPFDASLIGREHES